MVPTIPVKDGDVTKYNLTDSPRSSPKLYYVNGMLTSGRDHAITASLLSILCEWPVWGVYNSSGGFLRDFGQSLRDYKQNATARVFGNRKLIPCKKIQDHEIKELVDETIRRSVVWNQATASLFKEVASNFGQKTRIVAHSQGNLITSNALLIVERVFGSVALANVRVYSLASPSPAWPLGLSIDNDGGGRQDNGFMNDPVALARPHNLMAKLGVRRFRNAGDFRTHPDAGVLGLDPAHAVIENIPLNFLKSIREDLGLAKEFPKDFLEKSKEKAEEAINALGG